METVVNKDNFEQEIANYEGVVMADFWAGWCGPCKMFEPVVKQIAEEYAGRVKVAKINVDENPDLSARFGVMGIPTTVIFVNGEEKSRAQGYNSAEQLREILDPLLGA